MIGLFCRERKSTAKLRFSSCRWREASGEMLKILFRIRPVSIIRSAGRIIAGYDSALIAFGRVSLGTFLITHIQIKEMDPNLIDQIIKIALDEDMPWGDITSETLIDSSSESELVILLKEEGIVAGLPVAERVFRRYDPGLSWNPRIKDGDFVPGNSILARVRGKSRMLLMAERVALNLLQRLSGISTLTYRYVQEARKKSGRVRVVDTRKTTPGLRYLEKYAVRMGGGYNHRYCLSDSILVKDNHLAILEREGKSIRDAVATIKEAISHTVNIEVEVDSVDQIEEALEAGVDAILLDNMTCKEMEAAVRLIKNRVVVEASGGVSLETIADIAGTGVDLVSVGALTHSAVSLDISLDYQ